ncbi:hypothetical protein CHRYSEO8AT_540099 [Chryseobacterium sp. 8AT]|nr:hypothetical protein CHRYSEO8AT_540099 [Chryseobacterium sp. 8AT]
MADCTRFEFEIIYLIIIEFVILNATKWNEESLIKSLDSSFVRMTN